MTMTEAKYTARADDFRYSTKLMVDAINATKNFSCEEVAQKFNVPMRYLLSWINIKNNPSKRPNHRITKYYKLKNSELPFETAILSNGILDELENALTKNKELIFQVDSYDRSNKSFIKQLREAEQEKQKLRNEINKLKAYICDKMIFA